MKTFFAKASYSLFIVAFTSSIWFLALNDGTVAAVENYFARKHQTQTLVSTKESLQLEVNILELEIKKRAYLAQIQYMESQGF